MSKENKLGLYDENKFRWVRYINWNKNPITFAVTEDKTKALSLPQNKSSRKLSNMCNSAKSVRGKSYTFRLVVKETLMPY
jgi:hypothetical protein